MWYNKNSDSVSRGCCGPPPKGKGAAPSGRKKEKNIPRPLPFGRLGRLIGERGEGSEKTMSTERLVRKAQDGDKEAFLSLMKESELAMYRAAKAVLHREADVEDAVQETVLRAFYKIGDLRQPRYFKTWLTRILLNCCYDLLRTQRGIVPLELLPETGKAEDRDAALDVRETLASLGENDRLILTLFYLNDMAIKDIAQLLQISQGAVKQRLVTGRNHFKEQYEARERRAAEP